MIRLELEQQIRSLCESSRWEEATLAALRGYGPEILGWAVALTGQEAAAQDICQMFSIAIWRGLPSFRWESSFRVWAYRIAWREFLRFQSHQQQRKEQQVPSEEIRVIAHELTTTIHGQLQRHHQSNRLVELRKQLPEEMQALLILRVDRELSFSEISEVMGIEEDAARQKFKRAKDKLKEMAKKEGLLS